jgi:hypothetical protein
MVRVTGHRFPSRFGWVATDEEHLIAAARHVAFDPVRARRVARADDRRARAPISRGATTRWSWSGRRSIVAAGASPILSTRRRPSSPSRRRAPPKPSDARRAPTPSSTTSPPSPDATRVRASVDRSERIGVEQGVNVKRKSKTNLSLTIDKQQILRYE